MEPPDRQQCHILVVAPVRGDYKTAKFLLHERYHEISLKPSGATCLVGRMGSHYIVLAGNAEDMLDIASFTNDTVNDILKQFPSIKAGFLIGAGGIAPATGIARIGDVVAGTSRGLEPGLVQFDASRTAQLNRLSVTHQIAKPPAAVLFAVEELRSWRGRVEFQRELFNKAMTIYDTASEKENSSWSNSVKALHGKVASSETDLAREEVLNKTGHESKVFCFERAAASLKPSLPILTICGIRHTTNSSDSALKKQRSGTAAVIYAFLVVSKIDPHFLKKQHIFTDLFYYDSFSLERPGFRLVRLERGTQPLLRCSLFQAYLDDKESIIPYEALSYVWGSHTASYEIIADGKIMSITTSLHDALIHLRQPNEDRILWIDALCIDQSNIKERSHQVNHMGEIYRKSHNVIVWLGYVSGDAVVMKAIVDEYTKQLPPGAFENWSRGDQRWREQWQEVGKSLGISDYTKVLNGLNMFMTNPWFTRVWVLQEVANARTAVMECNLGKIPARLFVMLPQIIGYPVSEQCQAVLDILPSHFNTTSWWVQDRNLGTLLYKFKGSEASDPRDRVYALLGMASDIDASGIEADYAKEEQVIVQDLCDYIYGDRSPVGKSSMTSIQDFQSRLPTISAQVLTNKLEQKATKQSVLLFLNRQGMIKSLSNCTLHKLLEHGRVPTDTYLNKCEVPSFINLDIAEQTFSCCPEIFLTFAQKQCIPPVLMQDIVSSMIKNNFHDLQRFLKGVALAIDPGPKLITNLIMYGPTNLMPLLELVFKAFQKPIYMHETVFIHAIDKGITTLNFLLQNCRHPIVITKMILFKAVSADMETLRSILETPRDAIRIEEDAFAAATLQGLATVHFLLDHCDGSVLISRELLLNAIGMGTKTLEKVLDMSLGSSTMIDGSVLVAAAKRGPKTLRILLVAAAKQEFKRLQDYFEHDCDPGHTKQATPESLPVLSPHNIELTEVIFVHAVTEGPQALRNLFHYCIRPVNLTDRMLDSAIAGGIPILEVVFEDWASDAEISPAIIEQAAIAGKEALEHLLTNSKSKLQITDDILRLPRLPIPSYDMLLKLERSERTITEYEAVGAIQSGPGPFLELFNRRGTNFRLSKRICEIAIQYDYASRHLRRHRPGEWFIFRPEHVPQETGIPSRGHCIY